MSLWRDIQEQAAGKPKKEDDHKSWFEIDIDVPDTTQQVTYIGYLGASGLPAGYVPQKGQLFYIDEDCNMGHKGEIIIYTGNEWVQVNTVTYESPTNTFNTLGKSIDLFEKSTMYATIKK